MKNAYINSVPARSEQDIIAENFKRLNLDDQNKMLARLTVYHDQQSKFKSSYARASGSSGENYPIELRANVDHMWDEPGYKSIYIYSDQIDQVITELEHLREELEF